MDRVHRGGPRTGSKGVVNGPGVHVLYTSWFRSNGQNTILYAGLCRFLLRGRIFLKLGGNCPDIGGNCVGRIVRGANCPDKRQPVIFSMKITEKLHGKCF